MKLSDFHESVVEHYKLKDIAKDGRIHVEVSKGMHGLPQAENPAQKLLEKGSTLQGIIKANTPPAPGRMSGDQSVSHLLLMTSG